MLDVETIPDSLLRQNFSNIQDDFLAAVMEGPSATIDFAARFQGLYQQTTQHVLSISPDGNTLELAHNAAQGIAALAKSLMDLEAEAHDLSADMDSELTGILGSLSLDTADSEVLKPECLSKEPSKPSIKPGRRCFDSKNRCTSESQCWLLDHIRDPFPSPTDKQSLARHAGTTVKAINDWFTNARRKIGWTAFSKRYFRSDRSLTLDCAHRVLIEGSGRGAYCEEIVRGMEDIKATAERLYGSAVERDSAEPSSFAKELEGIDAQAATVDGSRKRRLSTSSTISEQSSASCSSSSSGSLRKRSRDSSEESDATSLSEESDTRSVRPLKRSRSVASSLSSLSSAPSFTTCSSESNESFAEVITPVSSPTHSKLPLELFDGWIDGLSAEPAFLPHDLADKPPQSVLSHKRSSPDSDSDIPSNKRARLEKPRASPIETRNAPISEPQSSDAATQPGATAPSSSHSSPQLSAVQPPAGEAGSGQPMAELDEEALDRFISQLDFNIPQAPVPEWDETLLGSSLEASLFDFSSIEMESGLSSGLPDDLNALLASISVPDAPLSASEEALVALYAPQHETQQECANEPKDAHLSTNPSAAVDSIVEGPSTSTQSPGSIPISLSSLDFAFLEGLDDAHPTAAHTSSPCDTQTPATLVDVSSSSEADNLDLNDPERTKKLERIDRLLAEAQRLQQEVFG